MGGFLNDLGLENVSADPNHIADGLYKAFVFNSEVRAKRDGSKSWVISYKIAPGQQHAGQIQQEWFELEPKGENVELKRSWLKRRVLSLGVPEQRVGSVDPGDFIGTEVNVKIVHRNGYQNVGEVTLVADGGVTTPAVSAPAESSLL